jgi:hypothetical protein
MEIVITATIAHGHRLQLWLFYLVSPPKLAKRMNSVYRSMNASYESKYTTEKPTQLATTPTAEYELVNIRGKNSYLSPNTMPCTREQYAIRGIDTVIYNKENLSRRKTRRCGELQPSLAT